MIIKNYKELCIILEESHKTGEAKCNQLKWFGEYFTYSKQGHKFIIDKVDKDKEIIPMQDNRHLASNTHNNGAYSKYIKLLVLNMLSHNEHRNAKRRNVFFIGKNTLLLELNMINDNYKYGNYNREKMANYLGIDVDYVHEFFNTNTRKLKDSVESALKNLQYKERLIDYYVVKVVGTTSHEHREATEEEVEIISECERSTMEDMNINDITFIYIANLVKDFYEITNKKLREKGILYYYYSYKIIFNDFVYNRNEQLMYILGLEEEQESKRLLNEKVYERLSESVIKRHNKTIEELEGLFIGNPSEDWIKKNKNYKSIILKEDFIKNNRMMIDMCIDGDYDDMRELISKAYVDVDILDDCFK